MVVCLPRPCASPLVEGRASEAAPTVDGAVVRANDAYDRGQTALASGDWEGYGVAQRELADALADLEVLTGAPGATPRPAATPTP